MTALSPRKTELKKMMALLEEEFDSAEDAALAALELAYSLYEGQAKFYAVAQVIPGSGRYVSAQESADSKVVLGPFATHGQAYKACMSLTAGTPTGESALAWPVEAWYDSPHAWYLKRQAVYKRAELFNGDNLREIRLALLREWFETREDGEEVPGHLKGFGWAGLDQFKEWLDAHREELVQSTVWEEE